MNHVRARGLSTVMQNKDLAEDFHLQGYFYLSLIECGLTGAAGKARSTRRQRGHP
jgi:hypothetical protein